MRSYIEKRLEVLIGEHANGLTQIRNLEQQLAAMRDTVSRITGAITVCQEALRDAPKEEAAPVKLSSVPADRESTPGARQAYNIDPMGDLRRVVPASSRIDDPAGL